MNLCASHQYKCSLPLEVKFHLVSGGIESIDIALHSTDSLICQIFGFRRDTAVESLIFDWMEDYAAKKKSKAILPLSFEALPAYTGRVLKTLSTIPFGSTASYQQVAELTGNPKAARAVGNACGRNPFLLVIPCHRILAQGLRLGGYNSGLEIKRQLLAFEGSF